MEVGCEPNVSSSVSGTRSEINCYVSTHIYTHTHKRDSIRNVAEAYAIGAARL